MKRLVTLSFVFGLFFMSCQETDTSQTVIQLCTSTNPIYERVTGSDTERIFIPNVFTPGVNASGDGNNDVLWVFKRGENSFQSSQLRIFDGNTLIYSNDSLHVPLGVGMDNGWNGQINGVDAPEKEYRVTFTGVDAFGAPFSMQGKVSLIRHFGVNTYSPSHPEIIEAFVDSMRFGNQWNGYHWVRAMPTNESFTVDSDHRLIY